jgi:signal transduction histidine kinase
VQCAVSTQTDYAGEFRIDLPDGTQHWVAAQGRVRPDADGASARMLGAAIDITERKRAEKAFLASEARLAAGTELAGLGCYEIDFANLTSFVDDRFYAICGIPAGHQQGIQAVAFWMEHLHPADRPRILDERDRLHDGRVDRISVEYRYLHPTEGMKWLHHLARVEVRDATGRGVRTYGVVRDITTRRSAEMEALELRGHLAHADRVTLLGQLASALAHELSQPLGAILRNAEAAEIMLQSSAPDLEELRAIVKDILSDDTRAGQVIDRLRSLLKRRNVDTQPINLPSVITEVLALVQADAASRHVKITFSAMPDLPTVSGDRVHLQQVMLNLLVNAMDALEDCPPDQHTIQVSALQLDSATVEVRVVDNGPGIPGDSLEHLFEPFFTTKSTGMGMGLPVSKTIIEAHKGKLWAENGPLSGACFCFTVPVASGASTVMSGEGENAK